MTELRVELPDSVVNVIAERAAELVLEQLALRAPSTSPFLTVGEAAEYLRCERQRIYDLLSSGRRTRRKDGSRVLLVRAELDRMLAGEATGRIALALTRTSQSPIGRVAAP